MPALVVVATCELVATVPRRRPRIPRRLRVTFVVVWVVVTPVVGRRRKMIPASTSATVAKQHNPATAHIIPCFQFRFILHLLWTTGKPSCWLTEHPTGQPVQPGTRPQNEDFGIIPEMSRSKGPHEVRRIEWQLSSLSIAGRFPKKEGTPANHGGR